MIKNIKNRKQNQSTSIKTLQVGPKTYTDDNVADGFFESISNLKTISNITSPNFESFAEDHRNIIEICKSAQIIPKITRDKANLLLKKIRLSVSDFYSITAAHYINGGEVALTHFCFLFNSILQNIELSGSP